MSSNKKAYFQGGEKSHEEAKTKRPYKAEPALVMQPRFKEPLYRNYDIYEVDGVDGKAKHGPGEGWHAMQNYKSVAEFLKDRRERSKKKYHAEDLWKQDDGSLTKHPKASKARMEFLSIIKNANNNSHDHFTCEGCGHRCRCKEGGKNIVKSCQFCKIGTIDTNNIDFPIDDQIKSSPIIEDSGSVGNANLTGGNLDEYLPEEDFEGKLPSDLEYGYDTQNSGKKDKLYHIDQLLNKYLDYGENSPLYGLSDGLPEQEEFEDIIDPSSGKTESGTDIYSKI